MVCEQFLPVVIHLLRREHKRNMGVLVCLEASAILWERSYSDKRHLLPYENFTLELGLIYAYNLQSTAIIQTHQ